MSYRNSPKLKIVKHRDQMFIPCIILKFNFVRNGCWDIVDTFCREAASHEQQEGAGRGSGGGRGYGGAVNLRNKEGQTPLFQAVIGKNTIQFVRLPPGRSLYCLSVFFFACPFHLFQCFTDCMLDGIA